MNLQELSLAQLKEIVEGAPEGAEYYEDDTGRYLKEKNSRSDYSQDKTTLLVVWCSNGWTDTSLSYSELRLSTLIKLSDIRARINELEPEKSIIENLKQVFPPSYSRIVQAFGEITEPVLKVGDRVVYLSHIAPDIISIFEVAELTDGERCYGISADDNCYLYYKDIRKATDAEEKAGHRIDEHIKVQCGDHTIEFKNLVEATEPQTQLDNEALLFNEALTECELIADPVNHPSHYTSDPSGIECIQITRHRNFNIGNAIKYLWRAGRKDQSATVQDLQKAIWYISDEIERLKGEQGE